MPGPNRTDIFFIDMFSEDPKLAVVIIIIFLFISMALIGAGCACFWARKKYRGSGQTQVRTNCVQCQLIEMGEMACYTGFCPGCGIPKR